MTDLDVRRRALDTATAEGRRWISELTEALSDAAEAVVFSDPHIEDPLTHAEGLRYMTRCLAFSALNMVENNDPAYPHLAPLISPWLHFALPNPDYHYLTAPVHSDHEYRVFGRLGTGRFFHVEVYAGVHDKIDELTVHGSRADFEIGPDREVEIVLSKDERPGNWVQLPPDGGGYVFLRQAYYDWLTEEPGQFNIERIGASYPPPPPDPERIRENLAGMVRFLRRSVLKVAQGTRLAYQVPENSIHFPPFPLGDREDKEHQVGIKGQFYGQGHYRCGPDEAVILEVTPPPCTSWMFGLVSQYMEGLEWHERQTSINGHQAVLDENGVLRVVIAHRDPGVPNWIDTGGREHALLTGRYFEPQVDDPPIPRLTVVPFDEVRNHFPADTPEITPEERSEWLRQRMLSVRRRLMSY